MRKTINSSRNVQGLYGDLYGVYAGPECQGLGINLNTLISLQWWGKKEFVRSGFLSSSHLFSLIFLPSLLSTTPHLSIIQIPVLLIKETYSTLRRPSEIPATHRITTETANHSRKGLAICSSAALYADPALSHYNCHVLLSFATHVLHRCFRVQKTVFFFQTSSTETSCASAQKLRL